MTSDVMTSASQLTASQLTARHRGEHQEDITAPLTASMLAAMTPGWFRDRGCCAVRLTQPVSFGTGLAHALHCGLARPAGRVPVLPADVMFVRFSVVRIRRAVIFPLQGRLNRRQARTHHDHECPDSWPAAWSGAAWSREP
jgi:hypothetical protein